MKGIGTLCVLWVVIAVIGGYHKFFEGSDHAAKVSYCDVGRSN